MSVPLEPDKIYHIYHQADGNNDLFYSKENYYYFLKQYAELLAPVMETYAYCLMPKHFHWLIKIKSEKEIFDFLRTNGKIIDDIGFNEFKHLLVEIPHHPGNIFGIHLSKQLKTFFSAYMQALNKQFNRKSNLYSHHFYRQVIDETRDAKEKIMYIHCNPVYHKLTDTMEGWKFSSYTAHLSDKPSMIKRDWVINLFDTKENFIVCHHDHLEKTKHSPLKVAFNEL